VLVVNRVGNRRKTTISIGADGRRVAEIGTGHQFILRSAASALTGRPAKAGNYLV
jgi:hypothetical protein